jgi:hypothetical protein
MAGTRLIIKVDGKAQGDRQKPSAELGGAPVDIRIGLAQAKSVKCAELKPEGTRSAPGSARSLSHPTHFDLPL